MCASLVLAAVLSLNGEWKLDYFPQPDDGAVRTLSSVPANAKSVKATVPGYCELDLVNAGLLPPMEIGCNTALLRPFEGYQWLYTRRFDWRPREGRAVLRFEGIDTLADIFLNGEKIGETDNMFIAHRFDVTGKLKTGENVVQVLIRSVMCDAQYQVLGELGGTMAGGMDGEPYRKAGSMGGWDIFPRVFASGLWREVAIDVERPVRVRESAWILTKLDCGSRRADYRVYFRVEAPFAMLDRAKLRVTLSRDGKVAATSENILCGYHPTMGLRLDKADLWWPVGMGESALYDGRIEILDKDGSLLAEKREKIGVRTVELVRDDIYGKDRPGQFLFKVNGEPCYVRGSNWVPLDQFHSRDGQWMRSTLEMFTDLNCNMVRVWGGGVYEPDEFFDYCDEHGIMVWQDFMTGCSMFPQNDEYAKKTEREVREVVLRLRNRASLVMWSGNNENDGAPSWALGKRLCPDPNLDRNSRRTIPDVIREFDVTRPYLPSSPYYSPDVYLGKALPSEEHLWGERAYYKVPFYTNSPCWFASEMGYHGCPNRASIERMMSKGKAYPWVNPPAFVKDGGKSIAGGIGELTWNDEWAFKASDWRGGRFGQQRNSLMTNQVRLMFGGVDTDFDTFVEQSQIIQAEAMKTFVELFRSDKFRKKNGLIWWNVRDGWPQISDAVVDYYGGRKKAYYAIRQVQRNQLVCVRDDHRVVAVNDTLRPVRGQVKISDKATGAVVFEKEYEVGANALADLGTVAFSGQGVLAIDWVQGGEKGHNHFLYGEIPFDWRAIRPLLADEYR